MAFKGFQEKQIQPAAAFHRLSPYAKEKKDIDEKTTGSESLSNFGMPKTAASSESEQVGTDMSLDGAAFEKKKAARAKPSAAGFFSPLGLSSRGEQSFTPTPVSQASATDMVDVDEEEKADTLKKKKGKKSRPKSERELEVVPSLSSGSLFFSKTDDQKKRKEPAAPTPATEVPSTFDIEMQDAEGRPSASKKIKLVKEASESVKAQEQKAEGSKSKHKGKAAVTGDASSLSSSARLSAKTVASKRSGMH